MLRGLNNQLGHFEVDRARPELVPFNGWREKMFMDNPAFRYWVADIRDDRSYRITGSIGDAVYQSVTVYSSTGGFGATAGARIDSDEITIDDGSFAITIAPDEPGDGSDWLRMPDGASAVWVRQFHQGTADDALGRCRIEPLGDPRPTPVIDPDRFGRRLTRLGSVVASFPSAWTTAIADDVEAPNEVRHWSEMAAGAAFTEPGIHYLRGSWSLDEGEALVIEGTAPPSRYWNVLLYSRFLNSLDHRSRSVSYTDGTARVVDGRYRFVVSATGPAADGVRTHGDWLDTEGRSFGLFVFRFLQPASEPELPTVRRCAVADAWG
ncbi:MAG: DUF1214 domain-containing protein [Actinobacteria bacterium]|nr:DUF1214 domain-containing protein [Actinomycetota bacterium]